MIITIDGPGGSGKSTIAKKLAQEMGISYLDTGAMYRAMAYFALDNGIDVQDEAKVNQVLVGLEMKMWTENGTQQVSVNGQNVTPFIRENRISMAASSISKHQCVRVKLVELQREVASNGSWIMDGRDTGSFVMPDADFKIYLTASADVRAERRKKELDANGQILTLAHIKADIEARDAQDMNREFAPLIIPKGGIVVDTSDMTIDEVKEKIRSICK